MEVVAMPPSGLNVVCILADDLGWRDLGCYGSSFYETPHLDRLAHEGARFVDAYASCPVCSPTRASVMTGMYPARVGITDWIDSWGGIHPARGRLIDAEYVDHLPPEFPTVAEVLGDGGYATWHVGKWHLGGAEQDALPTDRGFDLNIGGCDWGAPSGAGGYFPPWELPTLDAKPQHDRHYLPDRLGAAAASLIDEHDHGEPFFLNYDPYLVHTPLQAPDEAVERYRSKRRALGLDHVTEFERGDRFPTEHKKDDHITRRLVQADPTYAAMVEALDRNVGRVIDALERNGLWNETVIIFSSDNGGLSTAEGSPTTNRPLRDGKGWMQEGGNRVPLLVRWPGVTDTSTSHTIVDTPVISPDVYPTILDAAGRAPPSQHTIDGLSLRPTLVDRERGLERDAIFWHYPHYGNQGGTPAGAVRTDSWKLIEFFEDDHVELYDLSSDVSEAEDRANEHPDRVASMRDRLHAWQNDVGAQFPSENPEFEEWPERAGPG